ncbi:hypothetical protein EL26_03325 [Tumebacillus flagellatus]|uniref:Uncharacterized protein n=1 Tax=Tumebacillus flagellatus TaxID=1157490 RepID=A0A074MFN8_9BACL|nr:hypothetical protein EL26_03325 [Tumebacillus flagellatus]
MAEEIRKICYGKYKVLQMNPAKYNELYGKMKNLNVLLAWTHAAVIEDLLEKQDVKLAVAAASDLARDALLNGATEPKNHSASLCPKAPPLSSSKRARRTSRTPARTPSPMERNCRSRRQKTSFDKQNSI